MQWILLTFENVRPIVIVNVYRPPQGDYKNCCNTILEAFDNADLKENTDIFVKGDFNINWADKKSPCSKELSFAMTSLGLKQHITEATRVSFKNGQKTATTIDLIFSNSDYVKEARVMDLNLSDHQAVMVTRKKVTRKEKKVGFKGRSYRNYDKEGFQERLINKEWGNFFKQRDVSALWDCMEERIEEEIERMCPIKSSGCHN